MVEPADREGVNRLTPSSRVAVFRAMAGWLARWLVSSQGFESERRG